MSNFEEAKNKIIKAKDIAIAGHINPDGDSLGSLLSLGLALKKLNKRVFMLCADPIPQKYKKLPGANLIKRELNKNVDLAIAVDCSNKEVLGASYKTFQKAENVLEIDHHDFRRPFGNLRLIDSKAAAVGEIIYDLLGKLGVSIDNDIAQNLLTSIIVETNSFRLPKVRPLTFQICEELMNRGVDFYKLVDMIFWSKSKESAVLEGVCLSRCKFLKNGRIAWSIVRRRDFNIIKGRDEDVDHVADEVRSIKGVLIAVLFREKDRKNIRVSLRSKGDLNVASIAEEFKGGGHFDVAGCNIPNNPCAVRKVLEMSGRLLK